MGLIFFFSSRLYCFILKWQLSPLLPLRVFACALRLSLFLASRSQWGIQEAGCSAQRVQGAREAEAEPKVAVGRQDA